LDDFRSDVSQLKNFEEFKRFEGWLEIEQQAQTSASIACIDRMQSGRAGGSPESDAAGSILELSGLARTRASVEPHDPAGLEAVSLGADRIQCSRLLIDGRGARSPSLDVWRS